MWTSALKKCWEWIGENIGGIIIVAMIVGFIGLMVWAGISSENKHQARCRVVMSQMHTAQDSIHLYTFDKDCIEEAK